MAKINAKKKMASLPKKSKGVTGKKTALPRGKKIARGY